MIKDNIESSYVPQHFHNFSYLYFILHSLKASFFLLHFCFRLFVKSFDLYHFLKDVNMMCDLLCKL